ncbi:DUF6701 domain-containing protein [Shewanella sp. GXUN23E]|uniref:DUF6701 domain-containing protein n=1 Tax=Shewanella sp. GXUN23E TaxID=3422498 RepID=UPI003D7D6427
MGSLWPFPAVFFIRFFGLCSLLATLVPAVAAPLPACKQIFTDPVTGLHQGALKLPGGLRNLGNISCSTLTSCPDTFPDELSPGDYRFGSGHFSGISAVEPKGPTVRLYFDNLYLDATWFNVDYGYGDAANLVIYVAGNLTMRRGSKIHGIVYVAGAADIDVTSEITGGLATGGAMAPWWVDRVDVDLGAVEQADFGPLCPSAVGNALPLQFGHATASAVTFETPFPAGTRPLVFLMPTVPQNNTNRSAPAAAFLTSVDRYGFSYQAQTAPGGGGSPLVTPVDWIAVLPGRHWIETPTGKQLLVAGTEELDEANRAGSRGSYESVWLDPGLTSVLTQLQTSNNPCWLTSIGARPSAYSNELWLTMETSGANRGNICYPGGVNLNHLRDEQVAYLAMAPGKGTFLTPQGEIRFQAGSGQTATGNRRQSLAQQCGHITDLARDWFDKAPVLVGGLGSRHDNDGGWLRRCQLNDQQVSMVVDESAYLNREHRAETFSFVALEKPSEARMECLPIDNFSRDDLGESWVSANLPGSAMPQIRNGRLVITQNRADQAASLTYRYLFPANANAIRVSFDYYAWHRGGGRGGDGMAVVFSDARQSPSPGGFGGALGYAQRNRDGRQYPGFHGGWLGIALDSWGNFSSAEGGKVGGPGTRPNSVALRGAYNTGYAYLGGAPGNDSSTAQLSPPLELADSSYPGPGDHYTFLLDTRQADASFVSVDRALASGGRQQRILSNFDISNRVAGQRQRPEEFYISLTGSTGQAYNEHAIDNFQVCAIQSSQVQEEIHHFEFEYAGSPLACAPLTVTLKACLNASCSELFMPEVSADLTPRNGGSVTWLGANQQPLGTNTVRFVGGQVRLYLRQTSADPRDRVTLGVSDSNPSTMPYSQTLCFGGNGQSSCQLSFAEAGFLLDDVVTYAGRPVSMRLQAVKKSDNSLQCQPAFGNQTKLLTLSADYHQPRHPPLLSSDDAFTVRQQGSTLARLPKGSSAPVSAYVSFDRYGVAHLDLTYPDAGWLSLNATYRGSGQDSGLVMSSTNGSVRSVPAGLCLTPPAGAVCRVGDPAKCGAFMRAGEGFPLSLSAHGWQSDRDDNYCDNPLTPAFEMADIALGSELVAPAGGHSGNLNVTARDMSMGMATQVEQAIDEVGVFRFTAGNPTTSDGRPVYYLDAGLPIGTGATPPLGRFIPAGFRLSEGILSPGCNTGFSYMEQPFGVGFKATALNMGYQQTFNYTGAFARATAGLVAENADDGKPLDARLTGLPALTWQQGQAVLPASSSAEFYRPQAPAVDGPFDELAVGVRIQDNDGGLAVMTGADMNSSVQGDCRSLGCDAVSLGSQKMRFGRVRMDNVYGPQNANLSMPVTAEYWNGQHWLPNPLDQCTSLQSPGLPQKATEYRPPLQKGQHISRGLPAGQSHFRDGRFSLVWHNRFNPGGNADSRYYQGEISAPLAVPHWLKYYWQWRNGVTQENSDPRASAFFGRYRGDDKVIYWHEIN